MIFSGNKLEGKWYKHEDALGELEIPYLLLIDSQDSVLHHFK